VSAPVTTRAGCWSMWRCCSPTAGEAISDLAVLRDQPELFGPVASTATAWRVLDGVDDGLLAGLRQARAVARERLWAQREDAGRKLPVSSAGGRDWPGLVVDVDATLVDVHSEKQLAAPNFKGGFGFHPLLVWLDNTNEALAGRLRPGNAAANTTADHITVLDDARAQIPDAHRRGTPILLRADGAGGTKEFLTHVRSLRRRGIHAEFPVGFTMTDHVQAAITAIPARAWTPAIEANGRPGEGADVAEITGLLGDLADAGWPQGMRIIVRRERPHPGAQLRFTDLDGCGSHASPPIPRPGSWPTWRPGTARTPASRTAFAAPRTPDWTNSHRGGSPSTPSG
jgi:hypothetical protein